MITTPKVLTRINWWQKANYWC